MEKMNDYKKSDDIEADFLDLLYSFCRKWKQAAVFAIAGTLLLGGYSYLKNRTADTSAETVSQEKELTKEERSSVTEAVRIKTEIDGLEEYLEHSVLMQADAYSKEHVVLLYCIDGASIQELPKIAESYLSFLRYGKAAEAVIKENKKFDSIKAPYLTELISVWEAAEAQRQVILENPDAFKTQKLLYIEVTGKDAEMADQLAEAIQISLKEYASSVKKSCGNHILTLLDDTHSIRTDSTLQAQQREKRDLLKSQQANLNVLVSTLNEEQKQVYEKEAQPDQEEESAEADKPAAIQISFKYIILGCCGGIFIYGCMFACSYLLKGVIRSEQEFKSYYRIPFYGKLKLKASMSTPVNGEDSVRQMLARISLACKKQKVNKLYLLTEFTPGIQETEFLKYLTDQLKDQGIQAAAGESLSKGSSQWELPEHDFAVAAVCKIGATSYSVLNNAIEFYLENDVPVIGAVLLDIR